MARCGWVRRGKVLEMASEKLIRITIQGMENSGLLQHKFSDAAIQAVSSATRKAKIGHQTPREAAEEVCYRDTKGFLWLPGSSISSMLREAGSGHKQKGTRKSLKWIVPAAAIVQEDRIPLFNIKSGRARKRLKTFEVDSRPVVIPATKGRIMRHRPRLDEWSADLSILIDEEVLGVDTIQVLMTEGGRRIGVGDFRPSCGGPFGRFLIKSWSVAK